MPFVDNSYAFFLFSFSPGTQKVFIVNIFLTIYDILEMSEAIHTKRKLNVYEQSMCGGNYTQVPTLLLKGKWLEKVGFKAR